MEPKSRKMEFEIVGVRTEEFCVYVPSEGKT